MVIVVHLAEREEGGVSSYSVKMKIRQGRKQMYLNENFIHSKRRRRKPVF